MGASSTTYRGKWKSGETTVIRVPKALAPKVMVYARSLDDQLDLVLRESTAIYRTAADVKHHEPVNVAAIPHRSPFRYPGGKTWLVPYIRSWLLSRSPRASILVEPFAGGAIVGLTAGFEQLAEHVLLVERDEDVGAVWQAILAGQSEWLAGAIEQFDLSRDKVRRLLQRGSMTQRERAFATIVKNRVQRGGIMAEGAGLVKLGENGKGLHSRWYPRTLANRIREIAAVRHRFTFVQGDGFEVIRRYADDEGAAFFVDPPYTVAARRLYAFWEVDHRELFKLLSKVRGDVLLTYDNTREVSEWAHEFGFQTRAVTMKNTHHARMTELLIGKDLDWLTRAQASGGSRPRTVQAELVFRQ